MTVKIVNKETGQEAVALRWNLHAMSEIIVGFGENGTDSDFASKWVCACHKLPLGESENGEVYCIQAKAEKELDKEIRQALNENYVLKAEGETNEDCVVQSIRAIIYSQVVAERRRISILLAQKGQPWIDVNISYSSTPEIEKALETENA